MFSTLEANKATIENIRLWDWQPLSDTYAQLQEIRTYYKLRDLDGSANNAVQAVALQAGGVRTGRAAP